MLWMLRQGCCEARVTFAQQRRAIVPGTCDHLTLSTSCMGQVLIDSLSLEFLKAGIDPAACALGWARLLPSVLLVPAFGLRALPFFVQALFAFILAVCVAPALAGVVPTDQPWMVTLVAQLMNGLPVATSAAVTLWAATMAGNLLDELRGATQLESSFLTLDSPATPLGALFSLGAAAAFLRLGGASRLAEALSIPAPLSEQSFRQVALSIVQGIHVAVLLCAPLLAVGLFLSLFQGLMARFEHGSPKLTGSAALRSVALLAIVALLLDRIFEGLVLWMDGRLPPG
jgi:type III secretory pathway component EscT